MSQRILIVEDEESLAQVLSEYLSLSGFVTDVINDGSQAIEWLKNNAIDLLILDLMLPGKNGLDIYRELRAFSDVPVVMATARVDEIDRLIGLELGADDYICKPYSPREVVVRVKNILRRASDDKKAFEQILSINESTMQVLVKGQEVSLTRAEFRLLAHFHQHKDQVFSREQLMSQIYSDNRVVTDRTIDSHIKNLRRKIQNVDAEVDCIQSIYGVGYKFAL
ncbi:response regulator [Psychromonas sp. 14N.309.X.WAT.B.A12]|jgi:two-component system, OmpR family, response regulator BaeR|uniref:response regulator n=1 Tax=unclassified Psychromonas TaxID=2614957 RepID=UPI0025B01502|nr:response regulator [Psychromonas sp. 14N.309.X.WAT.B.A12]MDN2662612.1 response regulator [Psychromonas sp. 14N.309.X.WAT.B.A12]